MALKFWPIMGTICGLCAAPFTGGASLTMCAACAGIGFVTGSVIEKVSEDNKTNKYQLPPEAYSLQSKSIEENKQFLKDLKQQLEKSKNEENTWENKLEVNRTKQKDPNISKEQKEELKNEELLIIRELGKQRENNDELVKKIKKMEQTQTELIENTKNNLVGGSNWGDMTESLKPSFTTKLIIAGVVVLIIYLLMAKN